MRGFTVHVEVSVFDIGDLYLTLQCPYCDWDAMVGNPADLAELNRLADAHRKEHPWPTA